MIENAVIFEYSQQGRSYSQDAFTQLASGYQRWQQELESAFTEQAVCQHIINASSVKRESFNKVTAEALVEEHNRVREKVAYPMQTVLLNRGENMYSASSEIAVTGNNRVQFTGSASVQAVASMYGYSRSADLYRINHCSILSASAEKLVQFLQQQFPPYKITLFQQQGKVEVWIRYPELTVKELNIIKKEIAWFSRQQQQQLSKLMINGHNNEVKIRWIALD